MAEVYSAGDFRNGTTFEMDGNVFKVVICSKIKKVQKEKKRKY